MDLSRDEEGATQDRSNAPITTTHDPEQVGRTVAELPPLCPSGCNGSVSVEIYWPC